jgi:hypothetical protein
MLLNTVKHISTWMARRLRDSVSVNASLLAGYAVLNFLLVLQIAAADRTRSGQNDQFLYALMLLNMTATIALIGWLMYMRKGR